MNILDKSKQVLKPFRGYVSPARCVMFESHVKIHNDMLMSGLPKEDQNHDNTKIKIEKYICNNCGVTVICRDYDVVFRRKKMCLECCGDVPMSDETLRRIELKNNPTLVIKAKDSKNKLSNLEWKPRENNLRRESNKKKYKKEKKRCSR